MEDISLISPSGVIGRHLMVHGTGIESMSFGHIAFSQTRVFFDNKVALDMVQILEHRQFTCTYGLFSVAAVEPDNNFFLLKANVEVNDLMDKTELINAALAEESNTVSLYVNEGFADGGNSLLARKSLTRSVDVEAVLVMFYQGRNSTRGGSLLD